MRHFLKFGAAIIGAACLFAQPAMAHSFDRKEVNGEIVAEILTDLDYPAEVTTDGVGDPMVITAMSDTDVTIFFYNCDEAQTACEDIQFYADFDLPDGLSLEAIEEWNEGMLYGTAFLDEENDPVIKIVVQAGPGGTPELIEGYISTVAAVLEQFKDHIGFDE